MNETYCAVCGTERGYHNPRSKNRILDTGDWVCCLTCWKEYALNYFDYPKKEKVKGGVKI